MLLNSMTRSATPNLSLQHVQTWVFVIHEAIDEDDSYWARHLELVTLSYVSEDVG